MPNTFGYPEGNDYIASVERRLNSALERAQNQLQQTLDTVAPRPLGSKPVRPQEEFDEYVISIADSDDPEGQLMLWFNQKAQMVGRDRARQELIDFVRRNEAKLKSFNMTPSASTPNMTNVRVIDTEPAGNGGA